MKAEAGEVSRCRSKSLPAVNKKLAKLAQSPEIKRDYKSQNEAADRTFETG